MYIKTKTWVSLAKKAASACAFSVLLFAIHAEGLKAVFLIPEALASHDPACNDPSWYQFGCHLSNFFYHALWEPVKSIIFTFAWLIVAALWFTVIVIPRLAFWIVYEIVVGTASLCIMLSTKLIESAVYPGEPLAQGLLYNPNILNAIHTALWTPIRDIVHVGFALLLIAGAIITIVKANKDVIATYGPKFMVAIVLVNFSWFIPRVVLDLANVSAVASFSLAQCDQCYTIENVYLLPFTCTESAPGANPRLACPTLLFTVEEIRVQNVANPARKAMGALLDPFMEILNLRVLPRTGFAWERISKLFMIYNERNTDFDRELPPNPGYPPGWIGVANIIKCVWMKCESPPDPIAGRINSTGPFLTTISNFFVGAFLGTFRLIILVFLSAIFLVLYVFALLALMAMVLLRIPIIWLTIGFMPVVALAFVLGRGGTYSGFLWGVWDKFVGAAFIPAAIGIPIAAGSAILNVARNIGNPLPSTGIVADLFGTDGIIQIMFIIIAIIVIWLGVFAAISTVNFAGAAQQALSGSIQKIGQGAAMATGYTIASKAPILPLGAAWKGTKLATLVSARSTTALGKLAGIVGKGGGQTVGRAGTEIGKGAWWLAKKVPLVEAGTKRVGQWGRYVGGKAADVGGYVGRKAADVGGYVGGKAADVGGYVGRKARNMGNWVADATQKLKGKLPLAGISSIAGQTREKLGHILEPLLTEGEKLPQIFQPTAAEKKVTGWAGSAGKFLGEKALPGIASVAGSAREKIGNLFSTSALQKGLVGFAMKAGTGQLDTVFSEYAKGDSSLTDILNKRLRPQTNRDTAKKAVEKLDKNPTNATNFIEAAKAIQRNPYDEDARAKLITVIEGLRKDGIHVDTSRGLPHAVRSFIEAGREHSTNPAYKNEYKLLNASAIEDGLIKAEKREATPPPPPPAAPPTP